MSSHLHFIASFIGEPPKNLGTPTALRSPERIVGNVPAINQDIWSFGCLIFEFITGSMLFPICWFSSKKEMDDEHLLRMFDVIGPLPRDILSKWKRSKVYFNAEGEKIKNYIGELSEDHLSKMHPDPPLEEYFDQLKPDEMSDEDAQHVKRILRWILQYDVSKRPSTSELLKDPWFSDPAGGDNGSSSS